ncbi:hypothetical protein, partial [Serratia symbiotica]|uniref:hypothetical protein n=1 Tax=Serratia symbiotica TaxID=138074 RepID=UPI001E653E41
ALCGVFIATVNYFLKTQPRTGHDFADKKSEWSYITWLFLLIFFTIFSEKMLARANIKNKVP